MTDLDELAAEMRIVDLSDRVRQAHRHGVRRRLIVGGITAVIVAVVGIVAVFAPGTQRSQPPAGELDGTLITARDTGDRIVVAAGGDELLRLPGDAVDAVVSPNREWLAWRQTEGYFAAELPGGEARKIAGAADGCLAPAWAPDGEPLLLTAGDGGEIAWRDVETGDTVATLTTDRERSAPMCQVFPRSRPDSGYDLYYGTGAGFEIRYLSPDGAFTDTGVMKGLRDRDDWTALTGLSGDGTTACVRAQPGERRCDALIDLESGELLRTVDAENAWFLPDGGLLTTGGPGELVLRDGDGIITERAAAPRGSQILAYFSP